MSTEVVKTSIQVLISVRSAAPNPSVPSIPITLVNKLENFGGPDFYLTMLNLIGCLIEEPPDVADNEIDIQKKNTYYLCKNYILNTLEDSLYSVHNMAKSTKEM